MKKIKGWAVMIGEEIYQSFGCMFIFATRAEARQRLWDKSRKIQRVFITKIKKETTND